MMKPEEQERTIAAVMKGRHRASASPGPDCADAEVVAAFLDRTLSSSESSRWESHIAGCPYCTSLLSAAARADHDGSHEFPARARRWLLPAAGSIVAAAAATVFLYLRTVSNEPAAPTIELAEKNADLTYRASEAKAEHVAPPPESEGPRLQARDEAALSSGPQALLKAQPEREQLKLRKDELQSETRELAASNTIASSGAGANLPGATSHEAMSAGAPAMSAAVSGVISSGGETPAEPRRADERLPGLSSSSKHWSAEFSSRDGSVRWVVGEGGAIRRSTTGSAWVAQMSGVANDLLAGSAPSSNVCWIVGRGGAVLRTTDGEHWEKLNSPARTDLTAVSADSADSATVTTDGHRYATSDGGATWRSLQQQKN